MCVAYLTSSCSHFTFCLPFSMFSWTVITWTLFQASLEVNPQLSLEDICFTLYNFISSKSFFLITPFCKPWFESKWVDKKKKKKPLDAQLVMSRWQVGHVPPQGFILARWFTLDHRDPFFTIYSDCSDRFSDKTTCLQRRIWVLCWRRAMAWMGCTVSGI